MLYEKAVNNNIQHGIDNKHDKQEMEMIQGKIYNVPPSTPYWGLLIELGMKPIEYIIHSKRLMLYHNIINTKTKIIKIYN